MPQHSTTARSLAIEDISPKDILRFWRKVDQSNGPNACWPWKGKPTRKRYGTFGINGSDIKAHRVACVLGGSNLLDGQYALHSCDNPPCCNPVHIHPGDQFLNMQEMISRGRGIKSSGEKHWTHLYPERVVHGDQSGPRIHKDRMPRGQNHGKSKLTDDIVIKMRARFSLGDISYKELGRMNGISGTHAKRIIDRDFWTHI